LVNLTQPIDDLVPTRGNEVSRSQFFEWVRRGYVNKIENGRYVRYSIKALDAMLERFEQPSVRAPRHKRRMRRLELP